MRHPDGSRSAEAPFRYRRMRHDDLPRVMEIERAAFAHPWSDDLLARELSHDWSTVLLATEAHPGPGGVEAEAILGFVIFWLVHDELHVLNVAVAPEARRRGVARALMREAEERASERGARIATLEVRRSNAAAIELYRSMGYREVGVRPNYYAEEEEDAIVMEREIR
jgi:[ribosomal protein S18]-alanine N-acetyltransferase